MLFPLVISALVVSVTCMDNLRVAYEWNQLDFQFDSAQARQAAIDNTDFQPENNLPLGLEVFGDRLFVTVPRWKSGVAASLNYIHLNDTMEAPKLIPYPNWQAHKLPKDPNDDPAEIVSPFRVRADRCGRLWVVDSGVADLLGNTTVYAPPQLIVYDLHNDALIHRFKIPKSQLKENSFFATLAVEDHNCEDSYVYLADLGAAGLVVYSWKAQKSWRVKHHFFNIDPTAGNFDVSGLNFQWTDHLFGLALSAPDLEGFSTLYFHPMISFNEFSVSTKVLRDETLATDKSNFDEFRLLGSRGPKAQSGVSFLDQKTGVLFYSLLNLNAVACWRTTNPSYNMQSQGRIYMSNITMVFPNDIKVDSNGNLWVMSDRLPEFMYSKLNPEEVNFRILTAPVIDAIRGTACDSKLVVSNTGLRFKPTIASTPVVPRAAVDTRKESGAVRSTNAATTLLLLFAAVHLLHSF